MLSKALQAHENAKGKISILPRMPLKTQEDLSIGYTPGVAEPCLEIAKNKDDVYKYTSKGNLVAVVSDGTAVLGLGDIGPEAGMPVMEGKAILFKEFADVDAFPICVATKEVDEIIQLVKWLEPTFGGINLEDISAPRCFEIEARLKEELSIPVFHDDQHGTAIVVLAGLINACKIVGKNMKDLKVIMSGAGAAGVATAKILLSYGVEDIILFDSRGPIYEEREGLNQIKREMADQTNRGRFDGNLKQALKGADVFIGVSKAGLLTQDMVKEMANDSIIFAMANPDPEIMPDKAREAGAAVVATGRSDFPNQVNNVLAFPGIFRGVLDIRASKITEVMKVAAAEAIASYVKNPTAENIIPSALDRGVAAVVAEAVKKC